MPPFSTKITLEMLTQSINLKLNYGTGDRISASQSDVTHADIS